MSERRVASRPRATTEHVDDRLPPLGHRREGALERRTDLGRRFGALAVSVECADDLLVVRRRAERLNGKRPSDVARPSGWTASALCFAASHRWLLKMTVRIGSPCWRQAMWQAAGSLKRYEPSPRAAMTVRDGAPSFSPSAVGKPEPPPLECGWPKKLPGRSKAR